jgi:hypothetical protein
LELLLLKRLDASKFRVRFKVSVIAINPVIPLIFYMSYAVGYRFKAD